MKKGIKIYKLKPVVVIDDKKIDLENFPPFLVLSKYKIGNYEFVAGYPINFDWEFAGSGVPVFDEDDSSIPLTFLVEVWNRRILPKEFLEEEIGEVSKTLFSKKMRIVRYLETEHFQDIIEFRKSTISKWNKLELHLSLRYKILRELVRVDIILDKLLGGGGKAKDRSAVDMANLLLNGGVKPAFRGDSEEATYLLMKIREILVYEIRDKLRRKNFDTESLKLLIGIVDSLLYGKSKINVDKKLYSKIVVILENVSNEPSRVYKKIKEIIDEFADAIS